jgi:hypothetical protein
MNCRAYYRCTDPHCNIRKQVERDARNSRYVIVAYEGKHNHDVPPEQRGISYSTSTTPTVVAPENVGMPPPLASPTILSFTPLNHQPNNRFVNESYDMDFAAAAAARVAAPQAGPIIGGNVRSPGFPISPPLRPSDNVPDGRDFLRIGGYGIADVPFRGTSPPTDEEAKDGHNNE